MDDQIGGTGKRVGRTLYVHRSSVAHLVPDYVELIEAAAEHVLDANWNVAKIELGGGRAISLLDYENFADSAFPALRASRRVDLDAGTVTVRRYRSNPPILHRKELMLPPDAPERDGFAALTRDLESRGLFVDMAKRGRKDAWEAALSEAGIEVRDHRVFALEDAASQTRKRDATAVVAPGPMPPVARHRTAIGRNSLSAPMAALNAAGLLEEGVTVLDYGCGRGDDVRALRAAGIDAVGWDPHFAPDRSVLVPRNLVNLGFVLNVVEDPAERRAVLRRAFDLAERCLSVAVMLVGKGDVSGHRPHGDGFLSSRGTFQRYYTQVELRDFLRDTLKVTPVAAGAGIYFLFRDEELEQLVLSRRQVGLVASRPILSASRPPSNVRLGTASRKEALVAVRDDLVDLLLAMGRPPHEEEIPQHLRAKLTGARLSLRVAMADALAAIPPHEIAATAASRADELGRFFALSAFSGRTPYSRLSPTLQRDVRTFFGSLASAQAVGRRMLFDAGDVEALANDARSHAEAGLGYMSGDKYEVHSRDLSRLAPRLRTYIGIAQTLAGTLDNTTIYRVHLASRKLTALVYPDFDTSALPKLSERTKINLRTGEVRVFDHQAHGRVSVLLGKSRYMAGEEEHYAAQTTFDSVLIDLFGDPLSSFPLAEVAAAMMRARLKRPY